MGEEDGGRIKIEKPTDIKQITPYIWEIPKAYKAGMRVPARIVASKALMDRMDPGVFDQVTNVATLPGIQKYAYCMPDGHWGYGFPIGGVAAFDLEEGVISPGGIGFDINCLPGDARISLGNGTWTTIEELNSDWPSKNIVFFDRDNISLKQTKIAAFMSREENDELYELFTESGRILRVTKDHPILTNKGFAEAGNLNEGDVVFIRAFSGVKHEAPSDEILFSLHSLDNLWKRIGLSEKGNRKIQVVNFLKRLNLDEVRHSSPQLPVILKLMGLIFGDGSIYFNKRDGRGHTAFYGKGEDLEDVRKDLQSLGLKAQKIYRRQRHHKIQTFYGLSEFDFTEESLLKRSTGLALLLTALGTPFGNKTAQEYRVPKWIMKAPLWQKRLFLSSFFGAELSAPKTINKFGFYAPQLNMNKLEPLKGNAEEFLNDIRLLLSEFGISSAYPVTVEGNQYNGKNGKTVGLRLSIHGNSENLIKLYELIGYDYNKKKTNLAALASNYLRIKEMVLLKRKEARRLALELYTSGTSPAEIRDTLRSRYVSDYFINHSIWPDRSDNTCVPPDFFSFKEYEVKLVGDGIVLDKIIQIQTVPFKGNVYDFTIDNSNHNFIADNFVTHNCGMRLVLTNLTFKDVQPQLRTLVNKLYDKVPAGVGSSGFVKLSSEQFKEVVQLGAEWCVREGYGWEEDLERTEENGRMKEADVTKVSDKAISRGKDQIGTLGSGNHYLEIQRVLPENIIDPLIAKKWGIFPDQIVIMFHCGSRGYGHQVATDYLTKFLTVMESKYKIKILDRELACAPFNSPEGQDYFKAMQTGINMSFANRQVILHRIREVFSDVFKQSPENLGLRQVYDVAHNTAKVEEYIVDGVKKKLIVHRKGATRSLGPGRMEIPKIYRDDGQPIILGGSMETGSYLLVGTKKAEEETFGSTCHGSGRTMSRMAAKRMFRGDQLQKDMEKRGILVKTVSFSGLAEEAGAAYKSIDEVVEAVHQAGISKKVVKLIPIGNIKG